MNISIPLIATKKASHLGCLNYRKVVLENTQRRLVNRYALEPEISFDDFSCSAVVDWISVRFSLCEPTQHQWLKPDVEKLVDGSVFVRAVDPKAGGASDTFDIIFQEPELDDIVAVRAAIHKKYELMLVETVQGIEISVDFTPKQPDDVLRARAYTILTRHFITETDVISNFRDRPRFAYGTDAASTSGVIAGRRWMVKANENLLMSNERDRAPYVDATYYIGARKSGRRWRIMDKVIDRQNRSKATFQPLDETSKRVRVEVTLSSSELQNLGVREIDDLRKMSFSQLQRRFFKFMLPTFSNHPEKEPSRSAAMQTWRDRQRLAKFLNTGVLGLKAMDEAAARQSKTMRRNERKSWRSHGMKLKPMKRVGIGKFGTLVAYEALNEKVETALRHLGERVRAGDF